MILSLLVFCRTIICINPFPQKNQKFYTINKVLIYAKIYFYSYLVKAIVDRQYINHKVKIPR